jgi:lipoprotein-anchoring transpeptidase ErfK/SrfK
MPAPRSLDRWSWVLRAKHDVLTVFDDPSDGAESGSMIEAINPYGQPIAFPVRAAHVSHGDAWYRVLLGAEPNGSNGWVRGSDVVFDRIRHRVVVDLSSRTLRHYREGDLIHRFAVGTGAPSTPTTVGRFFVWAHLDPRDPTGPYGSYLLGLSGFSEVLTEWPGGGRLAIHGTDDPGDPGNRVSYGCARVFNPQMERLRNIPMGTTVLIRP